MPTGCKLFKNIPATTGQYWRQQVWDLNNTGKEIVLCCLNGATLGDIKTSLFYKTSNTCNSESTIIIENFCNDLVDKGILIKAFKRVNSASKIKITGSNEYFYPQHMMIELTSRCNLKCIHCYRESEPTKDDELPLEILISSLDELKNIGVNIVELTGGEPLMYYKAKEILLHCLKTFEGVALITNGTLIGEDILGIISDYKDKFLIQVDLDGPNHEMHDMIRGSGSFTDVIRAIKLLVKHGIKTRVAMNVIPATFHKIEETADLAHSLGATWFNFSPVDSLGRAKNMDLTFSTEEVLSMIGEIPSKLDEKYPQMIKWAEQQKLLKQKNVENNCGAGWRSFVLGPTGIIRPCPMLPENYLSLGNIKNTPLLDVFSNPLTAFLYDLTSPRNELCGDCKTIYNCGYCFARALFNQEKLGKSCDWALKTGLSNWWSPKNRDSNKSVICSKPSHTEYFTDQ
jgi:radical SAM protein with 4Fe4S-binding SPASM domain